MAASLHRFRGGLALQGPVIDDAAREFRTHIQGSFRDPSTPYHITLLTKEEYNRSRILPGTHDAIPAIPVDHLYFLGLGGARDKACNSTSVYWVVCTWAAGAAWRKALGLPPKDLHITLTADDVHSVAKDASSLVNPEDLTVAFQSFSPEKQDHVLHHLNSIRSGLTLPLTVSRALAHPLSAKDFLRLGDASVNVNPKLSMLAYVRALLLDPSSLLYIARRLRRLASRTHYGPLMTVAERESIPKELRDILLRDPWCAEARQLGHDLIPLEPPTAPVVDSRERLWCGSHELPRFFSWIVPYFLAGMSTPRYERDVDVLADLGITRVLTLTKEEPLPASWFAYKNVKNVFIPVENYKTPTFKEVDYFLDAVNEDLDAVWLVHCGAGKGRTGTILACYIAMYGFQKPAPGSQHPHPICDAGTVIRWLRSIRPGSIETSEQETFIASWISYRWKSKSDDVHLPEPFGSMSIDGRLPPHPELVILVGLPGSGKSWFSSALQKRLQSNVDIISQDESGSRSACESAISRRRPNTMLILDRCNPTRDERHMWLTLADSEPDNTIAVYFDIDSTICTQRIDRRIHHPTLRAGRSDNAMNHMQRRLSKPSLHEGFIAVITIPSMAASREAVAALSGNPPLVKFPRTQHLINLGAATQDDLVASSTSTISSSSSTNPIIIEEKVDGANMGISLDYNNTLVVQNRSHTVNSQSHAQFRKLDAWLEKHKSTLHAILYRDSQFPERYILYGEWMAATHSIAYSRLPDVFLAFDFYDRVTNSFASREAISRLLHNTGIHQVPVISTHLNGVTRNDLVVLMSRTSAFYDGPVEGVYVRFDDPGRLQTLGRGKVVRADFISGNDHWSKGIVQLNGIISTTSASSSSSSS